MNVRDRAADQHQSRRQERNAQFKVCFRYLLGAESAGGWGGGGGGERKELGTWV